MPGVPQPEDPAGHYRRVGDSRRRWREPLIPRLRPERRAGVLLMNSPTVVRIIGAPGACAGGVKDSWREVAEWAAGQLAARFGKSVQVQYFDLFDPASPPLPPGAQLPLVLVDGEVLTSGGKISIPAIRRRLEALGLPPDGYRV
jgi:hypothetical protein